MTWFAVGSAVVGAAGSIYSNNKAAGQLSDSADAANALLQSQYQENVARNDPYVTGGTAAENALLSKLGLAGTNGSAASGYNSLGSTPTSADVMATPGYQFGLTQGQNQLQKQLNASGQSYSGAALKAASQYGTDYATTKYQQAYTNLQNSNNQTYNELSGVAASGQNAINSDNSMGSSTASQVANNTTSVGNANASATLANNNAFDSLLNQGTSIYKTTPSSATTNTGLNSNGSYVSNSSTYTDPSSLYAQNGSDIGYRFADGGQVRTEPVVGSYSPVPTPNGGGTGGMSRDALIQALLTTPAQPVRTGVAALPANPVMNPQAILANRMQQAGAYAKGGAVQIQGPIHGPGGPTDDAIPVQLDNGQMGRLSNGEHVFDVASVNAMGNGSNQAGQVKLNKLRAQLKGKA